MAKKQIKQTEKPVHIAVIDGGTAESRGEVLADTIAVIPEADLLSAAQAGAAPFRAACLNLLAGVTTPADYPNLKGGREVPASIREFVSLLRAMRTGNVTAPALVSAWNTYAVTGVKVNLRKVSARGLTTALKLASGKAPAPANKWKEAVEAIAALPSGKGFETAARRLCADCMA